MNIVFLDAKTIGEDIDLSGYDKLGTVIKYGFSTTEEARERTKDADVVIVNKTGLRDCNRNEQSGQSISGCTWHCLEKCCRIFHGDGGTAHICPVILSLGKIKIL